MIPKNIIEILKEQEFLYVATTDSHDLPNVAPKFLLKVQNQFIYLIDYYINKTWENLKASPHVSLGFVDRDTLTGYRLNGTVEIIDKGAEFDKIVQEVRKKEVSFTAERIIEGVKKEKKYQNFEVIYPEHFVIFKVAIEEILEIIPSGQLKREKL